MNSVDILNRIKSLQKDYNPPRPERIFYSGPNYSEVALYYGDKATFKDIIDFWVSTLSWVFFDTMEFNDLTLYNERQDYPTSLSFCKEITLDSQELKGTIDVLNQFFKGMRINSCFKMSEEWDNEKYIFDCGESFFLYNRYTGE